MRALSLHGMGRVSTWLADCSILWILRRQSSCSDPIRRLTQPMWTWNKFHVILINSAQVGYINVARHIEAFKIKNLQDRQDNMVLVYHCHKILLLPITGKLAKHKIMNRWTQCMDRRDWIWIDILRISSKFFSEIMENRLRVLKLLERLNFPAFQCPTPITALSLPSL